MNKLLGLLTGMRAVGGIGNWLLPATTVQTFGFEHDPTDDFLNRLTGARELALAAGPVLASGQARRQWLRLALACDVLDTLAVGIELRHGRFTAGQAAGLAAFTLLCGVLTTVLLAE